MKRNIILTFCLSILTITVFSQEWEVPDDHLSRLAPFAFSDTSVTIGEKIFYANCKLCHGDPGKSNYQQLNPLPGDPAGTKIQSNNDGALQFKISEGRGLMPSFKNVLTPEDIWNVIAYIRSFNTSYVQSVAVVQQLSNLRWSAIRILLSFSHESNQVTARLTGKEGEEWTPVPDAEVLLTAERYFGHLSIGEPGLTNSNGVVTFQVPEDLPSNLEGGIRLTAELTDRDLFGLIRKDTIIMTGAQNNAPSLTAERAMWNIGRKAPVWLLITYPAGVLMVWGFIFYVLFQLRTVYYEGNDEEEL